MRVSLMELGSDVNLYALVFGESVLNDAVLKAMNRAKSIGFSDVLYLDSVNKKNLEEVSSWNIFIVKGKVISTPATNGTILEGITRKSIMEIASDLGYQVDERIIPVDELADADEVFCTGTAVCVAPVGSITYQNRRMNTRQVLQQFAKNYIQISLEFKHESLCNASFTDKSRCGRFFLLRRFRKGFLTACAAWLASTRPANSASIFFRASDLLCLITFAFSGLSRVVDMNVEIWAKVLSVSV